MSTGSSITRGLPPTIGLTFTPSGTNDLRVSRVENKVDKSEIRGLIPHSGTMCLLDGVIEWDDDSIVCFSESHTDTSNPLRREGQLSVVHALEYGAQAAAIHGGLRARAAGTIAAPGYLAAMRDAEFHAQRLDDITTPLKVRAERLFGENANTVYECKILTGDTLLARGRVTIMLRS